MIKNTWLYLAVCLCLLSIAVPPIHSFAECRGSNLTDPQLPFISNCINWAAYLQSDSSNIDFALMCLNNTQLALKCCWTCKAYIMRMNYCATTNLIGGIDCESEATLGRCDAIVQSTGLKISTYCPKACGFCEDNVGPTCSLLGDICGKNGVCTTITAYGIKTSQCICQNSYIGYSCSRFNLCEDTGWRSVYCPNRELRRVNCIPAIEEDTSYKCSCIEQCTFYDDCSDCSCWRLPKTWCLNGATCDDGNCECPIQYSGLSCEKFDSCNNGTNRCLNGGLCLTNGYCSCFGYTGSFCSVAIGCNKNGCKNGGTCSRTTARCVCPHGYDGDYCENYYGCDKANPCLFNGTCNANGTCDCHPGFLGNRCQTMTCVNSIGGCRNGGKCESSGCKCSSEFMGALCEYKSCYNGGTRTSDGSNCLCTQDFAGLRCETSVNDKLLPYVASLSASIVVVVLIPIIVITIICSRRSIGKGIDGTKKRMNNVFTRALAYIASIQRIDVDPHRIEAIQRGLFNANNDNVSTTGTIIGVNRHRMHHVCDPIDYYVEEAIYEVIDYKPSSSSSTNNL